MKFTYMKLLAKLAIVWVCLPRKGTQVSCADDHMFELLNSNATQIIKMRGYLAEDHYIVVEGGYILNLIKATNPLINKGKSGLKNRTVVFFLHGSLTNAKCFIVYSPKAKPRDLSHIDISKLTDEQVFQILDEREGSSHSLVFTLLDFGHEVWLLNRRGNYFSQGNIYPDKQAHFGQLVANAASDELEKVETTLANITHATIGSKDQILYRLIKKLPKGPLFSIKNLPSIPNPKYWDFSCDEQARYDLPAAIDYVRKHTGRNKLAFVGHSTGGALPLQTLSLNQTFNKKFTKIIVWAPALDLQGGKERNLVLSLASLLKKPLQLFYGDIVPHMLDPFVEKITATLCVNQIKDELICGNLFKLLFGPGGTKDNYLVSGDLTAFPGVLASHELAQLAQYTVSDRSAMYDYGNPAKNLIKYGSLTPPVYELSRITTKKIKFYLSEKDTLVPAEAIYRIMSDLTVPYEAVYFNGATYYPQIKFNHGSYLIHRNITRLLIIPCLRDIHEAHEYDDDDDVDLKPHTNNTANKLKSP